MKREPRVSAWAQSFLDDAQDDTMLDVTPRMPSQPLRLWYRDQVARAQERGRSHRRKAGSYAVRAGLAFLLWQLHLGAWVSTVAFIAVLICGLMSVVHLEGWNIASREANTDL